MNRKEIVQQTKLAFDYLQKLYFETSYLIKEIEGLLAEEEERFVIGRPGGYAFTNRSSSGLETNNVSLWPLRMLSVFLVPEDLTKTAGGVTVTNFVNGLKIIYLRIVLDEKNIDEPYINIGVIFNIVEKSGKRLNKFEHLITHIVYRDNKIFAGDNSINYKDSLIEFKGEFIRVNLFDVNSSDEIIKLVTDPVLIMFRNTK